METSLLLDNVAVGYDPHAAPVLASVSLSVRAGEFAGVVGPNGSGKSTLVRAMSRVLAPQAGAVLLGGRDLYAQVSARQSAQAIGVVPQTASASLEFTVREIVEMGRAPHLAARPFAALAPGDTRIVDNALQAAQVADMAHRLAPTLSGGEWQRVLLARALAQQPDVLLLDEPTAHLDLRHQRQTLTLARALAHNQNKAVLAVLHDLNLASEFCDRLHLVHAGRVAASGTPQEVLTSDLLLRVYQTQIWVRAHPLTGRPLLLSVPDGLPFPHAGSEKAVHVVCGMGTGAGLLLALRQAGRAVSCGILAAADPDAEAADQLGVAFLLLPAFTLPSPALQADEANLAASARAVVVAPMPFGTLNVSSLDSALRAQRAGVPVFCLGARELGARDLTQGTAASLWNSLLAGGATVLPTLPDLLQALDAQTPLPESFSWKP